MINPCEKEKAELENARKQLEEHIQNPLDWDVSSDEYQDKLKELQKNVREKEITYERCKSSS